MCPYMRCPKSGEMILAIFRRFFKLLTIFLAFLGTLVIKTKHEIFWPGIYQNFSV